MPKLEEKLVASIMPTTPSERWRNTLFGVGVAALVLVAYACGGGLQVGEIRERRQPADGPSSPLQELNLELFTTISASDTSSPVWSPDSSRVVFSDHYNGRLTLYDIDTKVTSSIYDSTAPPQNITDNRYNYEWPIFLDNDRVLSGPSWGGDFTTSDVWSETLLVEIDGPGAQPFGAYGTRPQVNRANGQILLETQDGMRLLDESGTEIRTYGQLYRGRWAPDGVGFLALQRTDPYSTPGNLVIVNEAGSITSLESSVSQAEWHPDGSGMIFVRSTSASAGYAPGGFYGALYYHDLEEKKSRAVAKNARNPVFLAEPVLVFFESSRGLGVSDLQETRILHDM